MIFVCRYIHRFCITNNEIDLLAKEAVNEGETYETSL